jgi:hypothetical protein
MANAIALAVSDESAAGRIYTLENHSPLRWLNGWVKSDRLLAGGRVVSVSHGRLPEPLRWVSMPNRILLLIFAHT